LILMRAAALKARGPALFQGKGVVSATKAPDARFVVCEFALGLSASGQDAREKRETVA
jgi:hypothetical protein